MEDLILIVDDARFARRIETKALQDAGFEHIVEAKTAKEALQIFEEQAPELTLLDITLPDNSDLTLLRTMMKIRPEAKIVMNSAIGQELIIQDGPRQPEQLDVYLHADTCQPVKDAATAPLGDGKPFRRQLLLQLLHLCIGIRYRYDFIQNAFINQRVSPPPRPVPDSSGRTHPHLQS